MLFHLRKFFNGFCDFYGLVRKGGKGKGKGKSHMLS